MTLSPTYKLDISVLEKRLNTIDKRADNLPWNDAGIIVKRSIRRNFDVGGRYSSKDSDIGGRRKWVKRKKTYPHPILKKTLKLRNSIYYQIIPDGVQVGSRGLKYNRAHDLGYPDNNLPSRKFVVVQPLDLKVISARFKGHIVSK